VAGPSQLVQCFTACGSPIQTCTLTAEVGLTPQFSCKHTTTIAAKPHPKSACQLQRSLGSDSTEALISFPPIHNRFDAITIKMKIDRRSRHYVQRAGVAVRVIRTFLRLA
jgi:hypothetical protein